MSLKRKHYKSVEGLLTNWYLCMFYNTFFFIQITLTMVSGVFTPGDKLFSPRVIKKTNINSSLPQSAISLDKARKFTPHVHTELAVGILGRNVGL